MGFWLTVLGIVFVAAIAGGFYLVSRFIKFPSLHTIYEANRLKAILIAVGVLLVSVALLLIFMGAMNTVICVIHLAIFWLVCDLAALIFKCGGRFYAAGICAISLTLIYLVIAWTLAHTIRPAYYTLTTDKNVDSLRIVQLADAHIGTTFAGDGFSRAIDKINDCSPDIVVITGDFVDDSTIEADFAECCEALKKLRTTYGIYYVFGNHDKSFHSSMLKEQGESLIISELEKCGVTVLRDETASIDDNIKIIGRQDFSVEGRGSGRASMSSLTGSLDPSEYIIVLDHQPRDYEAEAAAGADLVLSGHTHGGQLIPLAPLVRILGHNDLVYGHERRGNTDFIVTSGISDWAIKFKSGCRSEFVVIDVNK